MGSSGASRFSDYPERPPKKVTSGGGRGGVSGGSGGQNICDLAFSAILEDFERSEFYTQHAALPKVGTGITIEKGKRIVARAASGETIGNLPTEKNYLAGCIASGWSYAGQITKVVGGAVAKITIDAAPR
jgi:hypothetical protein